MKTRISQREDTNENHKENLPKITIGAHTIHGGSAKSMRLTGGGHWSSSFTLSNHMNQQAGIEALTCYSTLSVESHRLLTPGCTLTHTYGRMVTYNRGIGALYESSSM